VAILHVEKLGGLAGFGGTRAHIRSRGQIDTATLSAADQKAVNSLFQTGGASAPPVGADGFRFRISRTTAAGTETVEAHEAHVPSALASCTKDEFM
jgi:predicted flavoprotein YhiN